MKYIYTAIFEPHTRGYMVSVPDFPGCVTHGTDLQDALDMGRDVLSLLLTFSEEACLPIPEASDPSSVHPEPPAFTALLEADTTAYREMYPKDLLDPQAVTAAAEDTLNII